MCSCMGSMSVSSCRYCMFVSGVLMIMLMFVQLHLIGSQAITG